MDNYIFVETYEKFGFERPETKTPRCHFYKRLPEIVVFILMSYPKSFLDIFGNYLKHVSIGCYTKFENNRHIPQITISVSNKYNNSHYGDFAVLLSNTTLSKLGFLTRNVKGCSTSWIWLKA